MTHDQHISHPCVPDAIDAHAVTAMALLTPDDPALPATPPCSCPDCAELLAHVLARGGAPC